jgi:hypothetical protein
MNAHTEQEPMLPQLPACFYQNMKSTSIKVKWLHTYHGTSLKPDVIMNSLMNLPSQTLTMDSITSTATKILFALLTMLSLMLEEDQLAYQLLSAKISLIKLVLVLEPNFCLSLYRPLTDVLQLHMTHQRNTAMIIIKLTSMELALKTSQH